MKDLATSTLGASGSMTCRRSVAALAGAAVSLGGAGAAPPRPCQSRGRELPDGAGRRPPPAGERLWAFFELLRWSRPRQGAPQFPFRRAGRTEILILVLLPVLPRSACGWPRSPGLAGERARRLVHQP